MAVIALLGSGEFLPWARAVDRWCVEQARSTSDRVLVVPTASAPEGRDVFRRWGEMGTTHYSSLGLHPEVLELRTRDDAFSPAVVNAVAGARLVFFSGGNPGYLAETLQGTPFWDAVVHAVAGGTALGGCSAGAVFLGSRAPFVAEEQIRRWVPGLALLERAFVAPHFDKLDDYREGLRAEMVGACPEGSVLVGVDENTAICGDGERWTVRGAGRVWVGDGSAPESARPYEDGEQVSASLGLRLR